jgi:hypothetical protein
MEYRFKSDEWARLSPAERVRPCHLWAVEAEALAKDAPPHMREDCLSLARNWLRLAEDIEKSL